MGMFLFTRFGFGILGGCWKAHGLDRDPACFGMHGVCTLLGSLIFVVLGATRKRRVHFLFLNCTTPALLLLVCDVFSTLVLVSWHIWLFFIMTCGSTHACVFILGLVIWCFVLQSISGSGYDMKSI